MILDIVNNTNLSNNSTDINDGINVNKNKNNNTKTFTSNNIFLSLNEYEYKDLFTSNDPNSQYAIDTSKIANTNLNENNTANNNKHLKKCRVLILQGGGDKGAYQAGVIKALSENLPEDARNWDVITGISIGAVNAAVISLFEKGDEIAASDYLLDKWKNLKDSSEIYKSWLLGPIEGYFYKSGFYDTSPSKDFIDKILSDKHKQIKRKVIIGATEVKSGAYIRFNEEYLSESLENFRNAIMASSAYPVIFPNVLIGNQNFIDGGVKAVVDIPAGINKCFDMGFTAEQVFIDMILCNAISISDYDKESYNPIQILLRILELYSYEKTVRDIQESMAFYKNVNWRYLVKPKKGLPWNENPLNFSPEQIEEMIAAGMTDAKEAVQKDEGYYFKEFSNFFMLGEKDFFQVKYPAWNFYKSNQKRDKENLSENNK
jgi:predicted patatin/cPLA2 family phospholipase